MVRPVSTGPEPPAGPSGGGVTLTVGVALDADHVVAVERLRRRLDLSPPTGRSVPHISLLVLPDAGPDTLGAVGTACAAVAARTRPFTVTARGLAVFQSPDRDLVLYVPVARTPQLEELHADLFERASAMGVTVDGHFAPGTWFPHITLQRRGVTPAKVAGALGTLAAHGSGIAWTLPLTRLIELTPDGPLRTAAFRRTAMGAVPRGSSPSFAAPVPAEGSVP